MKAARELNRLRSNVASKCIEKFTVDATADPSGLIGFLHNSTRSTDTIEAFSGKIRQLIDDGNVIQFGSYFNSLSHDDLSQINTVEGLEIVGLATEASVAISPQRPTAREEAPSSQTVEVASVVQQGTQKTEFDHVLHRLLLAFELPKTFKAFRELDETQRASFSELGVNAVSAKNYKPSDCHKKILAETKDLLVRLNPEAFASTLPSILETELLRRGVVRSKVGEISGQMLEHISDENRAIKGVDRIQHLARQQGLQVEEITENPAKGANPSFTAMVNGTKHYIKTCSDDAVLASNGKVDPNELLVYKVMEYMNFGPKTNFLFGKYSSAAGRSSVSRGNYIMTEDLNQNGDHLLLDLEENKEAFEQALTDRGFTVELSAASALNDILSLTDTFGRNTRNYGLVERSDGSKTIQFVDHLPNANNGLFSLMDFNPATYSPRDSLQKRSNLFKADEHSAFKQLEPNRSSFQRLIVQRDVDSRLAPLSDAIARAESDVRGLMRNYSENFVEGADVRMSSYMEKITRNRATYEKTLPQPGQERL